MADEDKSRAKGQKAKAKTAEPQSKIHNPKSKTPDSLVTIFVMGKAYRVPANLTIMKAMEYAGYQFIRGCGCRGGFCGACGTIYRLESSYKVKVGLACQTVIEDGMYLTQLPFYPANKAKYDIEKLTPTTQTLVKHYPEIMRCISCNSCTKICPQDIDVMGYINAAIRGDHEAVADMSFDCIMCGLCASRCPAEIVHYNVALLARRIVGAKLRPRAPHLKERLAEIAAGKCQPEVEELAKLGEKELSERFYDKKFRDIEP